MKVDSPEIWSLVKSGRVKGFSIEGLFKRQESDKELNAELSFLKDLERILSDKEA